MAQQYRYLIIGGGMTADAAVVGIRAEDPDGRIALVSEESFPPYNRPPLSKGLFKGDRVEQIWRAIDYEALGVDLYLTTRIVWLDPAAHEATDSSGRVFRYEKCLLATGGEPVRLAALSVPTLYYRSLYDYFWLQRNALNAREVAVVGGGFIGSELAAALTLQHKHVHQIVPEDGLLARVLPPDLASNVSQYYREQGVEVYTGTSVTGARQEGRKVYLLTDRGNEIAVDLVVAGVGIRPRTDLAQQAGLQVDNGIRVNSELMTSAADVYAAGDVASVYNRHLGQHWRVEHEDNANAQGEAAGRNMAGAGTAYDYLPFFYSDLFDLGFEAVGQVDSRLRCVADWAEPFRNGIVYYLDEAGHVDGVLLWNAWDRVDRARALIESRQTFAGGDAVRGQIPLDE
ncbi:MAG: NAD(P)/FAD-dependent oxidoreductase [Clostridia bacterium]